MRLAKASITGFGRITTGTIDLTPRVIAVVGPNEAGKSTLLDALVYLTDTNTTLAPSRRSRTSRPGDASTVVRGTYVLEEAEVQSFSDLDLEELPRTLVLSRRAGTTTRYMKVEPTPEKSRRNLADLVGKFRQTCGQDSLIAFDERDSSDSDDDQRELQAQVSRNLDAFHTRIDEADEEDQLREVLPELRDDVVYLLEFAEWFRAPVEAAQAISSLLEWVDAPDPADEVRRRMGEMLPVALIFSDGDRNLPSAFSLSEDTLQDVPDAVQNLADMADLSLAELYEELTEGNRAAHGTRIRRANITLKRKFQDSWRQSNLSVSFNLENTTLFIEIIQDEDVVTPIDERSAGLRMYVALVAFLERRSHEVKPILLIDEAETHLHLDAQSDLVASFSRQQEVAKVIYTTHSPACLPADLGTNIRAVLPSSTNSQESTIENSFWRNASGFTPLMIAMGAGASAFATARFVVLAEGATEMLVLPSLIRASTDLAELPYQIAPGLSESSREDYKDLNLEGARVAFLVDSDTGGLRLKKNLIAAGVSSKKVVELGEVMLEHLLDVDTYRETFVQLLREWNPTINIEGMPTFDEQSKVSRPKQLEGWATRVAGVRVPGKRDVASYLAEHGKAIPSDGGRAILQSLHSQLVYALDIGTNG
ncbi:AAA family ATPase [Micrococcaceae bacterium Sec5.1]